MPMYRSRAPVINLDDGLSSIAKAFGPPSPQELAVMQRGQESLRKVAAVEAIRGGSNSIADYVGADVSDPVVASARANMLTRARVPGAQAKDFDAENYVIGNGNAGNTFAGIDVNNRAQMARTQVDQQGQTDRALLAPVATGATRFVPPTIAGAYDLPPTQTGVVELGQGQQATLPDGRTLAGAPKPLSMDEAKVPVFQGLDPALQRAITFGSTPTPTVTTPDGPRITTAPESIGQTPAPDATRAAQLTDYIKPDGGTGTARFDPAQGYVDTQTGEKLPAGIRTLQRTVQASKEEDLGSTAKNGIEQQLVDAASVEQTAKALRSIIDKDPGSQGIIGTVMGLGQDIASVGAEGAKLFGPVFAQTQKDIANGIVDPDIAAQMQTYNPNIPQIKLQEMLLAGQVAKMIDPNGRISNDRMKAVTESLGGGGFLSNANRTRATLDAIQNMVDNRRSMLKGVAPAAAAIGQGQQPTPPTNTQAPPAPSGSGEGTIIENDAGQRMIRRGGKWEAQ